MEDLIKDPKLKPLYEKYTLINDWMNNMINTETFLPLCYYIELYNINEQYLKTGLIENGQKKPYDGNLEKYIKEISYKSIHLRFFFFFEREFIKSHSTNFDNDEQKYLSLCCSEIGGRVMTYDGIIGFPTSFYDSKYPKVNSLLVSKLPHIFLNVNRPEISKFDIIINQKNYDIYKRIFDLYSRPKTISNQLDKYFGFEKHIENTYKTYRFAFLSIFYATEDAFIVQKKKKPIKNKPYQKIINHPIFERKLLTFIMDLAGIHITIIPKSHIKS